MEVFCSDVLAVIPIGLIDFLALRCTCRAISAVELAVSDYKITLHGRKICSVKTIGNYAFICERGASLAFGNLNEMDPGATDNLARVYGMIVVFPHKHKKLFTILSWFLPKYVEIISLRSKQAQILLPLYPSPHYDEIYINDDVFRRMYNPRILRGVIAYEYCGFIYTYVGVDSYWLFSGNTSTATKIMPIFSLKN